MKTMHKVFVLLWVAGLSVTACDNNGLPEEKGEPAVMTLSLNNAQTRAGDLFAGEDLITKVRIYVFNGNYLDAAKVYTSGTDEFSNPFRIKTTTGPKTVYVVANEPADLETALNAVTTISGLKAIVTSAASGPVAQPFTMTGSNSVDVAPVPDPGPYTQVTVPLARLAAKLTLNIKKGAEAEANHIPIVLKGVRLCRAAAKSALIEGQPVTGQTYWNHNYDGMNVPLTTTGTDVWTTPLHLHENLGSAADSTGRATYLVIDALYNNVNTRYIAYINDENSDATDHHYSIKRNRHYNLTATINNIGEFDGLTLSTYVLPWNLLKTEWLFDRVYTINPHPVYGNHTFTAETPNNAVSFTFKLDNPVGAVWNAHLTNPFDFEFSTEGGAVSSGGLGTEYTISVKPRNAQGTLRTTEFYITVDGTEIPLLQGTSLVGEGYRIVINQPAVP